MRSTFCHFALVLTMFVVHEYYQHILRRMLDGITITLGETTQWVFSTRRI